MFLSVPWYLWFFLAVVISLVWSRATTVGPVMFAWSGAAVGGFVSFIMYYDSAADRVALDLILTSALAGAACGLLFGLGVRAVYLRVGSRCQAALEAFAAAALAAGLGLDVGWTFYRDEGPVVPGALRFAAAGAGIGAVLAVLNWYLYRRPKAARPEDVAHLHPPDQDDGAGARAQEK
ncbi:MAG TPA: hypothetical protein PKD86_09620 [Gemmatales bacterium]|nr:hypothetical protein [Gemmatales bacterium]HMP59599.1 hypothetical protein [Gemmatales bacterium]